jgi:hypothetical protein
MAYVDFAATEARGMYSPPNGNDPQGLPDYWREVIGGPIRTDLPDLTDAELNALGWKGPIVMPTNLGHFTHDYKWNKETREYDATEISEYEKQRRVQYQQFWDLLINGVPLLDENGELVKTDGIAFKKIKTAASQSLPANTLATEFIALMSDAKNSHANITKIQEVLLEIVENITFTTEELAEIQEAFTQSGMFAVYTLE